MRWRGVLLLVVIAALLAAYGVYTRRDIELVDQAAPAQPGYYLRDAVVTETDASGAPHMKLRAAQINQNPRDNSIELQTVALDYQTAPGTTWLLTAKRGQLPAASRTLQFSGAVVIQPQPSEVKDQNHLILRTEALSVDTQNNIARAPGAVAIQMDQQTLTANGLKYDLKRQTLQLESRVHGQFQPQ